MNIGIIVFAYNRSLHLKKVLDGLKENKGVSKLYVFQDGLKCEEHRREWERTRQVIRETDWCEVVYTQSVCNKGLSSAIADGIDTVFAENDAVIVLEDDCVPAAGFIGFMQQCFEKYQKDKKVYSVSGYSWPIDLPQDEYDVYGCGRASSWGWGTWKDRWEQYTQDYEVIRRMNNDKDKSIKLAVWGRDLENMLVNRLRGLNDSWAIFWALHIIEADGICVAPYHSLIRNIGCDGSGTHCGANYRFDVPLDKRDKSIFRLPEKIVMKAVTKVAFADLYGSYTACESGTAWEKEPAIVYGVGACFFKKEKEICERYNIKAFIDRNKKGWFAGRKVIECADVNKDIYAGAKIIIMMSDDNECRKIRNLLTETENVASNRIITYGNLREGGSENG